jgi:hypothetical protein
LLVLEEKEEEEEEETPALPDRNISTSLSSLALARSHSDTAIARTNGDICEKEFRSCSPRAALTRIMTMA